MRTLTAVFVVVVGVTTAFGVDAIQLTVDGKTDYQIIIADEPSAEVLVAVGELTEFLKQITGTEFPVVKGKAALSEHQILVGRSTLLDEIELPIDWNALGPEGFVIRTLGKRLVIVGGPRRGTVNGVYTFLDEVIGCRWYTPTFSVIPHKQTLTLSSTNIQKVPVFDMRWLDRNPEQDWALRHRLNYFPKGAKEIDLKNSKFVGTNHFVSRPHHTLGSDALLPYAEFGEHPDLFALIGGERKQDGQPCLTNPGLLDVVVRNAKRWIRTEDPPGQVISISGGDHGRICECDNCKTVRQKHGDSGPEMLFVNNVAAELEKNYPDMPVDTLAYSFTQWPPRDSIMHRNVMIRYCPIHLCYHHAFDECDYNINKRHIMSTLKDWIRIAPRVYVWYYSLSPYEDPFYPYPNIHCLSRNFKLMRDVGVKGMMIQNRFHRGTGGLLELKDYLYVKLMWDPDFNVQKGIEEFCIACYGAAAPHVIAYVRLVNETDTYYPSEPANDSFTTGVPGMHMRIGRRIPIKQSKLIAMRNLFDKAERSVANDRGSLERVKRLKRSLKSAMK